MRYKLYYVLIQFSTRLIAFTAAFSNQFQICQRHLAVTTNNKTETKCLNCSGKLFKMALSLTNTYTQRTQAHAQTLGSITHLYRTHTHTQTQTLPHPKFIVLLYQT